MPHLKISNLKLGILVLSGLFLFILTLYIIGKNENFFGSDFEVRARFTNVNGLLPGNNIRFAGIQAGTVKRINIIDDTTIEVISRRAKVNTSGVAFASRENVPR